MEDVNRRIETLLSYGEKELYLSPESKAYARNRLLELLQTEPSYDAVADKEYDIEKVLSDLTEYAVENGIVDEEVADKFPDKLMNYVLPSQAEIVSRYDFLHLKYGRKTAEEYFLRLNKRGGYVKRPIPGYVLWKGDSGKGEFHVVIPTIDRQPVEEGFYPKCPYCLENIGFCGLPGESALYTKRILPFEIENEKWYFSYLERQIFKDEYIVASEKHRPAPEGRSIGLMADVSEKVPTSFVTTTYEPQIHEYYYGGKRMLPLFDRPVKKMLIDDDYQASIVDWFFSTLRLKCYLKSDLVKTATKVIKYWRNYSDKNIVFPIVYSDDSGYFADIVCLKKPDIDNFLIKKLDPYMAAGLFVLPHAAKREISLLISALGAEKVDFEGLHQSSETNKYLDWIIQIAAVSGTKLSYDKAKRLILGRIDDTCVEVAKNYSIKDEELENIFKETIADLKL